MEAESPSDQTLTVNLKILVRDVGSQVVSVNTQFSLKEGEHQLLSRLDLTVYKLTANMKDFVLQIYKAESSEVSATFISNHIKCGLIREKGKIKITDIILPAYEFDDLHCGYTVEIFPRVSEKQNNLLIREKDESGPCNVLITENGVPKIHPLVHSFGGLFIFFPNYASVSFYTNGDYVKVKLSELCQNRIVSKEQSYNLLNYMCFIVSYDPKNHALSSMNKLKQQFMNKIQKCQSNSSSK